jgi:hypothetical protein
MELFAECGNLFIFCEVISDRQQIPHQVRDDAYLFFWLDLTSPTCLLQAGKEYPYSMSWVQQVSVKHSSCSFPLNTTLITDKYHFYTTFWCWLQLLFQSIFDQE